LSLCLTKHHAVKTYWVWRYSATLTYPLHWKEVSGHLHAPATVPPEKEPPYPLDRGWMGPRASLDAVERRKTRWL